MSKKDKMLGGYISQLYRFGSAFITKELSKFNIGYGQFMFLIELYRYESICQEELAEILHIDKGTTARAIKKLEEQEYVIRVKDTSDRRAYKLSVTDKAKEIEPHIKNILYDWNDKLTSNLTEDEKKMTLELMSKIAKNQRICAGKEK
ncbi:MarR family winged helix-turn-helix transcriptional regulator [Clostridium folliculivorans]|uniref:MarR family transcriptional regulator n=1 Tax=Clostridium folliculivorans TaxID=2886038 RepID=A0A9W5Y3V3_9CLOT|nr:MarR family transcriptional regulator [Clostridium folliculivorans]GKU26062.1 MarR family transcriptional regulator [Clostridium folliculivorans]GKU28148.1 MarR family transcriptional regulator [Clostridium folliculivorans]